MDAHTVSFSSAINFEMDIQYMKKLYLVYKLMIQSEIRKLIGFIIPYNTIY